MEKHASAQRLAHITLEGAAGQIEAVLQESDPGEHAITAVVCHPHPVYGGTLHNKVVHRVASTLYGRGAAVLRFNFRGVGKSAGTNDLGNGELDDARVAWEFMRQRWPHARRWLAGFSFGSWIAARLGAAETDVEQLLLIAPPVHSSSFETMHHSAVPKRVVQGTADDICTLERLNGEFPNWAEPKRLVTVDGAAHFFDRKLEELGVAVRDVMGD